MSKILMLGNSKLVIFGFRGELVAQLVAMGHDVYVCFPNGPFGDGETISKEYGCHFIEIQIDRRGKNPLKDLNVIQHYKRIIREIKPDFVLSYTVKCNIYGGLACKHFKTVFLPNITGLGKGLDEKGFVQQITKRLYKHSLKKANCVFFQNEQDLAFFKKNDLLTGKYELLPGSGVNLSKFNYCKLPKDDVLKFLFIGRLMKAKGIEEYLYASKVLKSEKPYCEFHVCGYCEEDYKKTIDDFVSKGIIIYHGLVDNVLDYYRMCHCIVLPSFHPEGVSNVLLEAASTGRAIITTNHRGCLETVDDGITGFLVEKKNKEDLLKKMRLFVDLPFKEKEKMGKLGRVKMEKQFDREAVVKKYLEYIR